MESSFFTSVTFVMLVMTIKEIFHSEFFRNDHKRFDRLFTKHPAFCTSVYILSWCVTLWAVFTSVPGAIAGFLAGFAWDAVMTASDKT